MICLSKGTTRQEWFFCYQKLPSSFKNSLTTSSGSEFFYFQVCTRDPSCHANDTTFYQSPLFSQQNDVLTSCCLLQQQLQRPRKFQQKMAPLRQSRYRNFQNISSTTYENQLLKTVLQAYDLPSSICDDLTLVIFFFLTQKQQDQYPPPNTLTHQC